MALSISTLNNNSAVAKTFTLKRQADNGSSEWYNSTDSDGDDEITLTVKNGYAGKTQWGQAIRRALVSVRHRKPTYPVVNNNTVERNESCIWNLTLTCPENSTLITDTVVVDSLAYLRNFVTGTVGIQLRRGEL